MACAGRHHGQRSTIKTQQQFRARIQQLIHAVRAKAGKSVQVKPARKTALTTREHNGLCIGFGGIERRVQCCNHIKIDCVGLAVVHSDLGNVVGDFDSGGHNGSP